MKTELQKKHFRTFLQQKGIESVLNHYEDVNLRKGLSAGEREEMASDIQCRYLSEAGINKLPEEIRLKVIEINQKDSVVLSPLEVSRLLICSTLIMPPRIYSRTARP